MTKYLNKTITNYVNKTITNYVNKTITNYVKKTIPHYVNKTITRYINKTIYIYKYVNATNQKTISVRGIIRLLPLDYSTFPVGHPLYRAWKNDILSQYDQALRIHNQLSVYFH